MAKIKKNLSGFGEQTSVHQQCLFIFGEVYEDAEIVGNLIYLSYWDDYFFFIELIFSIEKDTFISSRVKTTSSTYFKK